MGDGVPKTVTYKLGTAVQIVRRTETRNGAPGEAAPNEVFTASAARRRQFTVTGTQLSDY